MLTALRDFTRDTLRDEDDESRLETIDVGDHTLWLVHGPRAYLACAIRGIPPVGLRDDLAHLSLGQEIAGVGVVDVARGIDGSVAASGNDLVVSAPPLAAGAASAAGAGGGAASPAISDCVSSRP